jgi:hypothetical protein
MYGNGYQKDKKESQTGTATGGSNFNDVKTSQ